MIAYDLCCSKGHRFEGWFEDRQSFDRQKKKNQILCPVCEDGSVKIVPSTFGIKIKTPAAKPNAASQPDGLPTPQQVVTFLEKNFEDVGCSFAKEALKMHYDVSEKRNIRGTSTQEEEKTLKKEGIKFFKIPVPRLDS
jgi:hypothetical protein